MDLDLAFDDYDTLMATVRFKPDWRWHEARNAESTSTDPYVLRYKLFIEENTRDGEIATAHELFQQAHKRAKIEAGTLAGLDVFEIGDRMCLYPVTIQGYLKLYFDLSPLDVFDNQEWMLEDIVNEPAEHQLVRQLRTFGFKYGQVFLDWTFGRRKEIDAAKRKDLADWLASVLLMRATAIHSEDLRDTQKFGTLLKTIGSFAKMISANPEVEKTGEMSDLMQVFIDQIEDPPVCRGLPDLESQIALPTRATS